MSLKSQGTRWGRSDGRVWRMSVVALICFGCSKGAASSRRADVQVQCLSTDARASSLVLPDSHWLRVSNHTVEKFSASGEKAWSVETPSKEAPLPGISVAANNTVYMRDKQRLLALSSKGAWLWERSEPIQGTTDASYYPAAMSDSGVVLRTEQMKYRAYSAAGALRWTSDVELKGAPIEKPLVLPNGTIIIRSADAFVALAPDDGIAL